MQIIREISELQTTLNAARCAGKTVGVVPTMGFLHEGHVSLIREAAARHDEVVLTIFVNPLQFGADEDLDRYPRDLTGDLEAAESGGATIVFNPSESEMYPQGRDNVETTVMVPNLASKMEGSSRPVHFAGVCTVVSKLFNICGPGSAYFGEKDFQQLAIVKQMAHDLSIPVEVVGCTTLRESDGLAMSSRNVNLTNEERTDATILYRALHLGAALIRSGETDASAVKQQMSDFVVAHTVGELDYFEIADPQHLDPVATADESARLFGAIQYSGARLIDNISATEPMLEGAEPPPTAW